ncbi:hypothetical protein GQ54DRAFT_302267 [Martensiomyces pterosporus]|nr:hypothetical protein GQ54DRAFT_302267 [Martensiomyces pterosporus]
MGDIFSSQWVDTEEYYKRIRRFKWISHQTDSRNRPVSGKHIYLTLAGNHDIGYGEETESYHINRYVNNFGPLNREWIIDVRQNGTSSDSRPHRVAILNAMNLDKTRNEQYRRQTWGFVRQLAAARRQTPDVPLILFLHIPLNKPGGVCVDLPETRYLNGFVDYQDYLSPVTSAYLLHCLAPTLVFNGHDHSGCLSAYSVDSTVKAPIVLSSTSRVINHIDDLCGMTFQELDAHQTELEPFIQDSISSISSKDMPKASSWTTVEVTVRSAMGAYGGAAGIFDIRRTPQDSLLQTAPAARVSNRDVVVQANGCEYQYREVPFANHLVIRVLLVVDLASFMVLSALFLVLR